MNIFFLWGCGVSKKNDEGESAGRTYTMQGCRDNRNLPSHKIDSGGLNLIWFDLIWFDLICFDLIWWFFELWHSTAGNLSCSIAHREGKEGVHLQVSNEDLFMGAPAMSSKKNKHIIWRFGSQMKGSDGVLQGFAPQRQGNPYLLYGGNDTAFCFWRWRGQPIFQLLIPKFVCVTSKSHTLTSHCNGKELRPGCKSRKGRE
jgi:hypothetical protein